MRQITEQSVRAFLAARDWRKANMQISTYPGGGADGRPSAVMFLHGNRIAELHGHWPHDCAIKLYDAGWQTNTTKDRLNGIAECLGLGLLVWQHRGQWLYADDIAWSGSAEITVTDGHAAITA